MIIASYDAKDVSVVVNGVYLTGYGEGTMVEASKDEDSFSPLVGTQGDIVRAKINNTLGTITVTLNQESPQVAYLNELSNSSEMFPISVIKKSTTEEACGGSQAYLKRPSGLTLSAEAESREFEFQILDFFIR